MRLGARIDPATVDSQTQWVVRIGTTSLLVWANSAEGAELRARTDCLDRATTRDYLIGLPVRRSGDAYVRPATDFDRHVFATRGAMPAAGDYGWRAVADGMEQT